MNFLFFSGVLMSAKKIGAAVLVAGAACAQPLTAGGVTYKDGDKYVKLGGRIQLQYHQTDPSGGTSTDSLRFRRLRPYIEGSIHKNWKGKFQWDMGKSDVVIKDAYFQYKGFNHAKVSLGNHNFAFSRELLTSSKYQQIVERTFVGDHNYGTPDRQPGVHLTAKNPDKFDWQVSLAVASHDPDDKKLDFEPSIQIDKGSDWSDGFMLGGRFEFQPLGPVKYKQGDLGKDMKKWYVGLGAYTWSNDDDNLDPTRSKADLDSSTGFEIGVGGRYKGFSADLQYNSFDAELITKGISSGIYKNSETTLESMALEAGYMIVANRFEIIAGYQTQDADNYADEWVKTTFGFNYFIEKHDVKVQVAFDSGENKDGAVGNDVDDLYVQFQYVF